MAEPKLLRRQVLWGALALLGGCGENRLARTVVDAARLTVLGHPDVPIPRSTVTNLPYASIAAKIGKGPRSLLILWRTERADLHWLSADSAAVVTRHGRVVKTAGFPENMKNTRSAMADPVAEGLHDSRNYLTYEREIDFDEPLRYGIRVESDFRLVGPRSITIAEIEFETLLVTERCVAQTQNWSFMNRYWVDPADGFVWKSEQTIARSFPAIEIEVLKPAA